MQIFGSQFISTPVMSLQTGQALAKVSTPLINPDNLKIEAYFIEGASLDHHPSLVRIADFREVSALGIIIDSSDEIIKPDDVISIDKLIKIKFQLIGISVVEDTGRKIGKVFDYTIDVDTFYIAQIYTNSKKLSSINQTTVILHRDQIIEVSDKQIIVKSAAAAVADDRVPVFVNPFAKSSQAQIEP